MTPRERLVSAVQAGTVFVVVWGIGVSWPQQPAHLTGGWLVVDVDPAAGWALCVPGDSRRGEDVGEYVRADRAALDRVDRELREHEANLRPAPPACPVWGA